MKTNHKLGDLSSKYVAVRLFKKTNDFFVPIELIRTITQAILFLAVVDQTDLLESF